MADVYDQVGGFVAGQIKSSFKGAIKGAKSAITGKSSPSDESKSGDGTIAERIKKTDELSKKTVERVKKTQSFASSMQTNFRSILGINMNINSISDSVTQIVRLMGGSPVTGPGIIEKLKGVKDKITSRVKPSGKNIFTMLKDLIFEIIPMVLKALTALFLSGAIFTMFFDEIKAFIQKEFENFSFKDAFSGLLDFMYEFFGLDYLVDEFKKAKENFMKEWDELVTKITNKYDEFKKRFIDPMLQFIKRGVTKIYDRAPGFIQDRFPVFMKDFIGVALSGEQIKAEKIASVNKKIEEQQKLIKEQVKKEVADQGVGDNIRSYGVKPKFFPGMQNLTPAGRRETAIKKAEKKGFEEKSKEDPVLKKLLEEKKSIEKADPSSFTGPDKSIKSKGLSGDSAGASTSPEPVSKVSGDDDIKAMIIGHEDVKYQPYKDSKGLYTVGVGHLIGTTLPKEMDRTFSATEVNNLFESDYAKHKKIAERTPGYNKANKAGKAAMIDLAFNMGAWYKEFKKTAAALKEGDFVTASKELENSDWYNQVGSRGPTIVSLIASAGDNSGGSDLSAASAVIAKGKRLQTAAAGEENQKVKVVTNNNNTVIEKETMANVDQDLDYMSAAV